MFFHFSSSYEWIKGTIVAGEVSQLCLIGFSAAVQQRLNSYHPAGSDSGNQWGRLRCTLLHYKTMHGLCLIVIFLELSFLAFSFTKTQQNHTEFDQVLDFYFTFNYNLWFCPRTSSSIYSVMWLRIPTLQRTACGVGSMFRFLQINFVWLPLYCDRLNQSNVNKHS